jgi:hypothetical protein
VNCRTELLVGAIVLLLVAATPAFLFVATVLANVSGLTMLFAVFLIPALISYLIRSFLKPYVFLFAVGAIGMLVIPTSEYLILPVDSSGLLAETFLFVSLVMFGGWTLGWLAGIITLLWKPNQSPHSG